MIYMFEILLWCAIFYFVGMIAKMALLRHDMGPFSAIVVRIRLIGVFFHELSHYSMCILLGVPVSEITVKFKDEKTKRPSPHGSVSLIEWRNISFIQALLVGLAPLLIHTYLIFFCLDVALSILFPAVIRIIAAFLCLALILGAAPSNPDLKHIIQRSRLDPRYSSYQLFLVILSGFSVWLVLFLNGIILPIVLMYYFFTFLVYFVFKYSFRGINALLSTIFLENERSFIHFKPSLTRKNHKPMKNSKLGKRTAQW